MGIADLQHALAMQALLAELPESERITTKEELLSYLPHLSDEGAQVDPQDNWAGIYKSGAISCFRLDTVPPYPYFTLALPMVGMRHQKYVVAICTTKTVLEMVFGRGWRRKFKHTDQLP